MTVRSIEDIYPLSPTQRGMLSHLLNEPDSRAYFEQFHCELYGDLDCDAFSAAWQSVVDRHPVLRTAFDWEEADEPLQVVLREVALPLSVMDWCDVSGEESAERLEEFLREDRERGFSLEEPPLMRLALIRQAEKRFRFVWSHHHLLLDGWCRPLLFQEVLALYESASRGRSPRLGRPRPFRDYIAWLQQQDAAAAEAFWREQLQAYQGASLVPDEAPPGRGEERRGEDNERVRLNERFSRELELSARLHGVTLNTVIQAAWALLLSRYCGSDDLAFGVVVSGRPPELEGVESMVGLFINSLPLRVRIPWDRPLASWLQTLQRQSLEILQHSHVFLGDVRRWSELPPGRRIFDSLLAFQNFPVDEGLRDRIDLEVRDSRSFELSEFPLSLVIEPGLRIGLWLGFDPHFVPRAMAVRILCQYEALLHEMVGAPARALREFPILTESERWQLLGEWNDTGQSSSPRRPVHHLIAEQARKSGEALAIVAGERRVSYRELLARAGQTALALREAQIEPGAIVAILMERSPEHLAALLGVLEAGAAFLCLDPAYPRERLRNLLSDSRAAALLSHRSADWEDLTGSGLHRIDLRELPAGDPGAARTGDGVGLENLAYVYYTSGSTGFPKGVAVDHGAFACFALEMAERLSLGPGDRMLQFASPAFDVLLEEVFPVWLRGGAVVLESPQTLSSPHDLAAAMAERGVTVAELPAAYWHAWLSEMEAAQERPPASLRLLLVGAERPAADRVALWRRYEIPLIYVFGLTETAVTSSFYLLGPNSTGPNDLPIGRPLHGVRYYVTDPWNGPAPLGATGELYIGGAGLAIGYLGRPEVTAERFVPDPWSGETGARLYRTGDRVRYRPDGNLDFLGRSDDQVKVRGFRIELGEVEAGLRRHPAVADAVVAVQEEPAGERRLVGYICPSPSYSPVGLGGAEGGALLRERRLELWPSHGEYPIYDTVLYHQMGQDEERNRRYRQAIRRQVPGKVVLDVGTGGEAVLARFCVEAGAARVYAIERSPMAFEAARELVGRLGLAQRIQVILGEATECDLPERVDVCVSELIGTIGSSEAVVPILNQVRRRCLKPGGEMVPRRCTTRIAAVEFPQEMRGRPRFGELAAHYAGKVLEQVGENGHLRVCVRNFPASQILSEWGVFEELDFAQEVAESYQHEIRLRVSRAGRLDGFLLWIELEPEAGDPVSALEHHCSWLPLVFPIFEKGEVVAAGDEIEARVGGEPSPDGVHPDYWMAGALHRQRGERVELSYRSPYRAPISDSDWFGHRLLAGYQQREFAPEGETITPQGLRSHLSALLPEYMVPSIYVAMPSLPLTPSGKIDRRTLPTPGRPQDLQRREADVPRNEIEDLLREIWREVLEVEVIGIHDNFFELGGDSILSIQVAARARRQNIELAPWQLFEEDTIAKLAALVAAQRAAKSAPLPATSSSGSPVLTPVQRWFFEQDLPEPWHWNMPLLLAPRTALSPTLLERGLGLVVERHQALSCKFVRQGTEWTPELDPAPRRPVIHRIDLGSLPGEAWERALEDASGELQGSLDLGRAPLLATAWFDIPESFRVLFTAHHLVVDALSWRILIEELEAAYLQLLQGQPVELPVEPIGFPDWSRKLAGFARAEAVASEVDHWLSTSRVEVPRLPVDRPEGRNLEGSAQSVRLMLPAPEVGRAIRSAVGTTGSHLQDLLLTALVRAVGSWTGERRLRLDLEGHGREGIFPEVDPSRTVGWFTSVFPVLLEAPQEEDPLATLRSVRRQIRAIPRRGIGFGLLRYMGSEELRSTLSQMPAAELSFNYLGRIGNEPQEGHLFRLAEERIGAGASPLGRRGHLLEVNAWLGDDGLEIEWTFSTEIHLRTTIERLAADLLSELRSLLAHRAAPGLRGYAPTDFPLAKLDPAGFERLAGALEGHGQIEDLYLLSPLQQGMLFHSLLTPGAGMYVAQLACELSGEVDFSALVESWQRIVDHHGALRAAFYWEELDRPVQILFRRAGLPWAEVDLSGLPSIRQEESLESYLRADRRRGFKADRAPLLRLCLFRLSPARCRLVLTFHQMLVDGWSLPLVVEDVLRVYESKLRGTTADLPARRPYRDYIEWWLRQDAEAAESYWRQALAGAQPTLIPKDAPEGGSAAEYAEERLLLPERVHGKLQEFARRNHLTLNTLAQAAWGVILGRHNDALEAILGVVVSGRPGALEGIESAIGLFVNTLPLRVPLPRTGPLAGWLHEIQRRQTELRRYEHSPLAEVQRWAGVTPSHPLFESILVFQNYPVTASLTNRQAVLGIGAARTYEQTHYGLTLVVEPLRDLQLTVSYPCDAYRRSTVSRMLRQLTAVLQDLPRAAEMAGIRGLTEPERHQALVEWNDTQWNRGGEVTVPDLFFRDARENPHRVAAVYERTQLTAGGLLAASGRLAARLHRNGIRPETPVAVFLERSLAPLIAMLAVFRTGGIFVPIDPAQPRERVALLLLECAAAVVITQSSLLPDLPPLDVPTVCLDVAEQAERVGETAPVAPDTGACSAPAHLAYIIFTSGSTGRPKAVAVEHRQLSNYVRAVCERLELPRGTSFATVSSFATDLGHTAIFPALANGGCLHVLAESRISDPMAMEEYFANQGVDCLKIVPSHLAVLLSGANPQAVLPRRCLILGGEAADPLLIARIRELSPSCDVHNHYGPTETTVGVSTFRLPLAGRFASSALPIGRPLPGMTIHLLDRGMDSQPIGAPGEIYIGGQGVARGYLGQPAATAERFVPDPWGKRGARLYRTGDLARRLADGAIEFLGRIDGQVKVRGYRVELSEVEASLRTIAGIREAAVVLSQDSGDRRLVAYAVRQSASAPSPSDLRTALRAQLPEYMVPFRVVFLEVLPRLPSGKIDRRALFGLAEGLASSAEQELVPPRTPLEQRLAEVWAEVLHVQQVGIYDDFFEHLGGHSLLATQAISRLRRELHIELPLRSIFDQPTVARLAQSIAEQLASEAASEEIERLLDELEEMPSVGSPGGTLS